jgi:hypothetical protein
VKNILSVGRGDKILLENSSSCQVDVNAKQVAICQKYLGYIPARRPKIQKSPNCRQLKSFACFLFSSGCPFAICSSKMCLVVTRHILELPKHILGLVIFIVGL